MVYNLVLDPCSYRLTTHDGMCVPATSYFQQVISPDWDSDIFVTIVFACLRFYGGSIKIWSRLLSGNEEGVAGIYT